MSGSFDPYRDWLGLPKGAAANLYELLGVPRFEPNQARIGRAADQRLAQLSDIHPGEQLREWEQLCRDVVAARDRLCDRPQKAAYDAELRRELTAGPNARTPDKSPAPSKATGERGAVAGAATRPAISPRAETASRRDPDPMAPVQVELPEPAFEPSPGEPSAQRLRAERAAMEPDRFETTSRGQAALDDETAPAGDHVIDALGPLPLGRSTNRDGSRTRRSRTKVGLATTTVLLLFVIGGATFVWRTQQEALRQWWNARSAIASISEHPGQSDDAPSDAVAARADETAASRQDAAAPSPVDGRSASDAVEPADRDINDSPPASTDGQPSAADPATSVAHQSSASTASAPPQSSASSSSDSAPSAEPAPGAEDGPTSESAAALATTILRHRAALRDRQPELARRLLAEARQMEIGDAERARLDRELALVECVAEFWRAVRERMGQLPPTSELSLRGEPVAVVEASSESLTVRSAGGNQRFTQSDLPFELAMTLAQTWFDPAIKDNNLFLGAAHFVDVAGNRDEARRLWNDAVAAGAPATLLPLLDELQIEIPSPASADLERAAIPAKSAVANAQKVVRAQFATEFKIAKAAAERSALARRLVAELPSAADDAERYALLLEARNLAVRGDDARLLLQVVDETARGFDVDAWRHRSKACELATKELDPSAAGGLCENSLELARLAAATARPEIAISLARSAASLARRARDSGLVQRAERLQTELRSAAKSAPSEKSAAGSR